MKKIMIALGAVIAAACVHAASVDWTITYTGKGSTWVNSDVSVFAFSGKDYDAIIKLVTVDGSENLASDLAGYALDGSGAKFTTNFKGSAKTATINTADAPNSIFWMILTDGSTEAGKNVAWTAATDVSANQYTPPNQGSAFGLTATNFSNSGTIAAVPEPTSGLLLLLGVAGLALRRKQK